MQERTTLASDENAAAALAPEDASGGGRRALLTAAVAGAVATTPLLASEAEAATGYVPARWRRTYVPPAQDRHMANRFAYGYTPTLGKQMQAAGGARAWFLDQLQPQRIPDKAGAATGSWWPSMHNSPQEVWRRDQAEIEGAWEVMANYARWCLARRIISKRQVLESMAEFWENHLYIPVHDDGVFGYRVSYGKMIRTNALGKFDDLLVKATLHSAMGISLDNVKSTKYGVNENLGRELLELHTVGQGNYTEDDVKNSARILTGFRVDMWNTWKESYDPSSHHTGAVKVMGFSHANSNPDGRAAAEAYLRYLAHHPKTAERIARKLAKRFVSDAPSQKLVDHLASVYRSSDTAIKPVLIALIDSEEFKASQGQKVRTPTDDVIASYRALGIGVRRPVHEQAGAVAILWQTTSLGQAPFDWPRPDGPPEYGEAWTSASRMLSSFDTHWGLAGGWWPRYNVRHRSPRSRVPVLGMRFDQLVDHLSREMHGRTSSAALLKACCQATGVAPRERITLDHPIIRWKMPWLLSTLLDHPAHMSR